MSSKAFTAQVFRWLAQVNADDSLPASCTKIAVALVSRFDEKQGGVAWPGFQWLADEAALFKSVVIEGVRLMKARGHLKTEPGKAGRGHSTRYWMLEKGREPDLLAKGRRAKIKGRKSTGKGRPADLTLSKGDSGVPKGTPRERERFASLDLGDGGRLEGAAPQVEKEESGLPTKEEFEQLRAIWAVRPWLDDPEAEWRAWDRATERGGDPNEMLAAGRASVAAADAPRFLPPLARWLDRDGWRKPPPAKRASRGHKVSGTDIASRSSLQPDARIVL